MAKQFLEAGKIVGTHGVKGELKVEPWVDSPEFLKKIKNLYFDEGTRSAGLISSRVHKNLLLITLCGVDSATAGDLLRGKLLYLNREDVHLPKNRYFISDLIGLSVYDGETGKYYGIIDDVYFTGANSVYRILSGEKEYLFPAVDHMIKKTDLEEKRIEVLPIPGIFDDGGYSDAD